MCFGTDTVKVNYGEGPAGETEEQKQARIQKERVSLGLVSGEEIKAQSLKAPDLGDATDRLLRGVSRSNLLKDRLSSAGRRGSFLAGSMGDVTKDPGGSILGGM